MRRRERVLRAAGITCLLLLVAALPGCSRAPEGQVTASAPSSMEVPRSGGTLRYPLAEDANNLLPFLSITSPQVVSQIFEGLTGYDVKDDGSMTTVPCLAESWEANADATVWTFHLRRGVRFQQPVGREVTAADVVADFRFTTLRRNKAIAAYLNAIIAGTDRQGYVRPGRAGALGVVALDRYTVRFTLKGPFASFPDTLGGLAAPVWPVDYLRRVGRAGFQDRPVGTGPFAMSRRVRGRYIDLVRNVDWWDAASGQPYLDGVHFVLFRSQAAQLQAFQQGRLDYARVPQGQVDAARSLPQVESGEWVPLELAQTWSGYACFNMDDPVTGGAAGLTLRRAIDAAIDRTALVAAIGDGTCVPQTGLVPPIFAGWQDEQPAQPYDPAEARRLYTEAGSPRLTLSVVHDTMAPRVAAPLRRMLVAAGMSVKLDIVPLDEFYGTFNRGQAPAFYLTGWAADYPSYGGFLYEPFLSSLSPYTMGTCYSDADVDRLLTLARSTADPARRLDQSRRAAHEILADQPVLPLFEAAELDLLNARIGGFVANPYSSLDAWKLWVK